MDAFELKHLLRQGESTFMQFKERVNDAYKVGCELVAFSNAQGGRLIVGVSDKTGEIKGLSFREIQETNALLSNAASEQRPDHSSIMLQRVKTTYEIIKSDKYTTIQKSEALKQVVDKIVYNRKEDTLKIFYFCYI